MRLWLLGLLCLLPALLAAGPAPADLAGWQPAPVVHADSPVDPHPPQMTAQTQPAAPAAFVPVPVASARPMDPPPPLRADAEGATASY